MKRSIVLISITFLLLFINKTYGDQSSFYVGVGYARADYEGDEIKDIPFLPGQRLTDDTNMLDLYAGYHFNDYLSFEIGYSGLGVVETRYQFDPDIVFVVTPNNLEERDINRLSIDTILEYPVFDKASVFGLLGYSYYMIDQKISGGFDPGLPNTNITDSFNEDGIYIGIGGKYEFNDKYSARLQWTKSETDDFEIDTLHISLEMNFNVF